MRITLSAIAVAFVLLSLSCNQANKESTDSPVALEEKAAPQDQTTSDTAIAPTHVTAAANEKASAASIDWDKKIIRNGTVSLETKDFKKYYQVLSDVVKREGGYIAQEDQQQNEYQITNNILIKVPVDRFQEAMELITTGTGNETIKDKKVTSEDVTTEVVDTKSRIETKKEVRMRYLDLLKEAKNMKDILNVQSEINNIQGEMETAAGRLNYLSHASAYSTINLSFFQVLNPTAIDVKDPGFAVKFLKAFGSGWDFIKALIIGVTSIWPFWFLLAGVWILIKRWKVVKTN
jgi:hypothetical protein